MSKIDKFIEALKDSHLNPGNLIPDKVTNKESKESDPNWTSRKNLASRGMQGRTVIWKYPEMVSGDEVPNYVMFFVNIPEARSDAQAIPESDRVYYDTTSEQRITIEDAAEADAVLSKGGSAVGAVAGAAGAVAAAGSGMETTIGKMAVAIPAALTGGVAGYMAGGLIGSKLDSMGMGIRPSRLVHMPVAIALQITDKPSASYHAEWADQEMGMLGNIAMGSSMRDIAKYGMRDALMGIASAPKLAGMGVDFKALTQKGERRIKNPQKEQLFKSMGFREFSYEHHFMPRNGQEALNVFNIINLFKQYMHPEMDTKKLFLHYPAEWSIIHYHKGFENDYLHKVSSCALRDVKVAYGGNEFTTFSGTRGMPSEIFLQLQFVELEIITANKIADDLSLGGF
jgi:hypothetical protein